jgi:hypothetical protein
MCRINVWIKHELGYKSEFESDCNLKIEGGRKIIQGEETFVKISCEI